MLSLAAVGIAGYGFYSVGLGAYDALFAHRLDLWADLLLILVGIPLAASSVLVRLTVPGGLALAVGAMLALQALSIHNDMHWYGRTVLFAQFVRAAFAAALIALAFAGARASAISDEEAAAGATSGQDHASKAHGTQGG